MAGSAFKDAEVIKVLSKFTPILVDGDVEKDVKQKFHVNGYPNTIFADAKGEPVGTPIVGAVPVDNFLKQAEDFAKKIKSGKPSKDFTAIAAAKTEFDQAVAKKQIAAELVAIAKIEKINHAGPTLDEALAAKKLLLEDGRKRLDAAKEAAKGDGKDAALKELKKLAAEYKGVDVGTAAAKLVKELEPPPENK